MAADRIALEAETRLPRKDGPVVLYDAGEGLVEELRSLRGVQVAALVKEGRLKFTRDFKDL